MPDHLNLTQARDIALAYTTQRLRFPAENETTALLVVLLNYGDHLTPIMCVGPERWTGTKADLEPGPGLPHCPNGRVLMEGSLQQRLGLVDYNPMEGIPHAR